MSADPSEEALSLARDWLEQQEDLWLYELVDTLTTPLARLLDLVAGSAADEGLRSRGSGAAERQPAEWPQGHYDPLERALAERDFFHRKWDEARGAAS